MCIARCAFPDGFAGARCGEINRFGCRPARFISVSRASAVLADFSSASVTRITVPSAWRSTQNLKNSQVLGEPRAREFLLAAARRYSREIERFDEY